MKVQIQKMLNSTVVMEILLQQRLNGAVAFKLHEIIREVRHKLNSFNDSKAKILESSEAKLNEEKNEYEFPSDEIKEKANKEFEELLAEEVDIHARPLTLADLEGIPSISAEELSYISWAINTE